MKNIKRIKRIISATELYQTKIGSDTVVKQHLISMLDEVGIKNNQQITITTFENLSKEIAIGWFE